MCRIDWHTTQFYHDLPNAEFALGGNKRTQAQPESIATRAYADFLPRKQLTCCRSVPAILQIGSR
jgi:hypothetical protein